MSTVCGATPDKANCGAGTTPCAAEQSNVTGGVVETVAKKLPGAQLAGPEISLAEIAVEFIKSVSAARPNAKMYLDFYAGDPTYSEDQAVHAAMNTQDVRWALGLTVIKDLLGGHKAEDVVREVHPSPQEWTGRVLLAPL